MKNEKRRASDRRAEQTRKSQRCKPIIQFRADMIVAARGEDITCSISCSNWTRTRSRKKGQHWAQRAPCAPGQRSLAVSDPDLRTLMIVDEPGPLGAYPRPALGSARLGLVRQSLLAVNHNYRSVRWSAQWMILLLSRHSCVARRYIFAATSLISRVSRSQCEGNRALRSGERQAKTKM